MPKAVKRPTEIGASLADLLVRELERKEGLTIFNVVVVLASDHKKVSAPMELFLSVRLQFNGFVFL